MKKIKNVLCCIMMFILIFNFIGIYNYSFAETELGDVYEDSKNYKFSENDINSADLSNLYHINTATIPSSFSLKDYINMPVENQKNLDISKIFSTLKTVETNYALTSGMFINLSERYIDYMTSKDFYGDTRVSGKIDNSNGSSITSSEVITFLQTYGATTEEKVPYKNYTSSEYKGLKEINPELRVISSVELPNIQKITDKYLKMRWIDIAKLHIMNYGAISTNIESPKDEQTYNESTKAMYYKNDITSPQGNQSITIVGWDDNYSKENFKTNPNQDGAFICLNSWGENWGDKGYFYVSYEDDSILKDATGTLAVQKIDRYNQYGTGTKLFTNQTWTDENNKIYGMKLTKNSENEFLTHITIGAGQVGTNGAKVRCYLNPIDDSFDKEKMILLQETGTILSNSNYTNISLSNPVNIVGTNFALVFEFVGNIDKIQFTGSKDSSGKSTQGKLYYAQGFSDNWSKMNKEFVTFAFTTNKKAIKLNLKKQPNKTIYVLGEELELDGCTAIVEYDTGEVQEIKITNRNAKITGYNPNQIGEQIITITYQGVSVTFKVEVKNSVMFMNIQSLPTKVAYVIGEELDLSGGILSVTYKDGTISEVPMTSSEIEITGYDPNTAGKQIITLKYQEMETTLEVEVKNEVVSIKVKISPSKTTYLYGEQIELIDGVILVTYSDGSVAEVPMESEDVKAYGYDASNITEQIVTAMYQGETATFKVKVKNGVKSIQIKNIPKRTKYLKGENLDITGGNIEVTYADASTDIIPLSADNVIITNYKPHDVGEQVIRVSYKGKNAEYKVKVNEKADNGPMLKIIFCVITVCIFVNIFAYKKYRKYQGL